MSEQQRIVIGERRRLQPRAEPTWIWHLPVGKPSDEFQPVVCGGGIMYPGTRQKRPRSEVCPDCVAGHQTMPVAPQEGT
ncbi:hypothetical protein [Oerskovia paurometabola]|uniref:hypothetical protein n=1 Tax=Oerskovia paurometabola TaxID=162170 RepID=UPI0037F4AB90